MIARALTVRRLPPALVWGTICGLLLGIGARIVMRFVAHESGLDGAFSVDGSLEVVTFGLAVGAPLAWLFFVVRPRVPLTFSWVGVFYGIAIFLLLVVWPPPSAQSALADTPDTPGATAGAFALLFIGWGWLLDWVSRRIMR